MVQWSVLLNEIQTVIEATWPEITVLLHIEQGQRRSYEGLVLPFGVYHLGPGIEAAWGIGNVVFEREVRVYYLRRWSDAAPFTLSDRLEALKSALLATSYPASGATLLDLGIDDSPENPANSILISKNVGVIGGYLSAQYIAGESAVVMP